MVGGDDGERFDHLIRRRAAEAEAAEEERLDLRSVVSERVERVAEPEVACGVGCAVNAVVDLPEAAAAVAAPEQRLVAEGGAHLLLAAAAGSAAPAAPSTAA